MANRRKSLGHRGEVAAADYLRKKRYKILEQNYRTRLGELDIVAQKRGVLVFVEVKSGRRDPDYDPLLHLDARKQRKLLQLAKLYLAQKGQGHRRQACRIDLITVKEEDAGSRLEVDHYENVIHDTEP